MTELRSHLKSKLNHQTSLDLSVDIQRSASVALILRPLNNSNELELGYIQRAENPYDPWSGHVAFPGGVRETTDSSLRKTKRPFPDSSLAARARRALLNEGFPGKPYVAQPSSSPLALARKSVAYKDLSFEELKGLLVSVGLPAPFAEILADSDIGASRGDLFSDSKDLSRLIERPTTTLNAAIKRAIL